MRRQQAFMRIVTLTLILFLLTLTAAISETVPGVGVDMVPPPGFQAATLFPGFEEKESQAFIMLTELPVSAEALAGALTKDKLASRGMELMKSEDVVISGASFLLLQVEQDDPARGLRFEKLILALGDKERTILVTGGYPVGQADALRQPMREALLSSSLTPASSGVDLDGLTFEWDQSDKLRPGGRILNALLFSPEGAPPPQSTFLIVAPSLQAVDAIDPLSLGKTQLIEGEGFDAVEILSTEKLEMSGLPAAEIIADAKDATSGEQVKLYQLMILDSENQRYLRVIANTKPENFELWISVFRDLAQSVRFKD